MMAGSHTTLGCELIHTETPGWADMASSSIRDLWGNLQGCWRKWWWQLCRWYTLFLSHHWVNNLCDGSEQDFLEELQAWWKTTVLTISSYLKTSVDFEWKVELLTLGYWSHFSISLCHPQNYSNICSTLRQQNKTISIMASCWMEYFKKFKIHWNRLLPYILSLTLISFRWHIESIMQE